MSAPAMQLSPAALVGDESFPREVEFILSALEAGPRPPTDRHKMRRSRYRVQASLKLYSDPPDAPAITVYTRDASANAIGFVAPRRLALSHGGVLVLPSPKGETMHVTCTIFRCREIAPDWFEGAIYFNREQPAFAAENLKSIED